MITVTEVVTEENAKTVFDDVKVDTWKTKDGRVIPIRHLKNNHLNNIISYLEKGGWDKKHVSICIEADFIWDAYDARGTRIDTDVLDPTYAALVAERTRRENERDHRRELRQQRLLQRTARQARVAGKATCP